jgi:uncharacterized membrane protein
MNDWLVGIALKVAFNSKPLAVMLVSMIPMIELKGGILIALKSKIGFNYGQAFFWGWLGSTLVCIPLYFILSLLFKWKPFARIENLVRDKAKTLLNKTEKMKESNASPKKITFQKFLGVLIFVAIPIPLTGVWTGTLVAKLLDLKFHWTLLACIIGNAIAGGIITLLAFLLPAYLDLLLWILFSFVVLAATYTIFKIAKKQKV